MHKTKREVSFDGRTYKVRSDSIEIPNFDQMSRFDVLKWLLQNTYARGYSKPNPLQGLGEVVNFTA